MPGLIVMVSLAISKGIEAVPTEGIEMMTSVLKMLGLTYFSNAWVGAKVGN